MITKPTYSAGDAIPAVDQQLIAQFTEMMLGEKIVTKNEDGDVATIYFPNIPKTLTYTYGEDDVESFTDGTTTWAVAYDEDGDFLSITPA